MTNRQNRILTCVSAAIEHFNANEQYLISRDLSERCICAKFASYLERVLAESQFSEYTVDVEYNRGSGGNEYAKKVLQNHNIVVDLVVHKRGQDENLGFDNLFCIEMKKGYTYADMTTDKQRLQTMTNNLCGFCYKAGFMIVADRGKELDSCKLRIDEAFYNSADTDADINLNL